MKGKINDNGILLITRRGVSTEMECPFYSLEFFNDGAPVKKYCGDWCPKFGEPEPNYGNLSDELTADGYLKPSFDLEICQGQTLNFDELEVEV